MDFSEMMAKVKQLEREREALDAFYKDLKIAAQRASQPPT